MDPKQLDLFQTISEHESQIFAQAKISKGIVQSLYNELDLSLPIPKSLLKDSYSVLRLNIIIDLATDLDTGHEPNSPRVFIWHFTPKLSLILNDDEIDLNNDFKTLLEPKVIKSWINTLYTSGSFSQSEFQIITSHYFTLETLSNLFDDSGFLKYIENKVKDKNLIIYFENRLFPTDSKGVGEFMESDMLKKINNYFKILEMVQKKNWYYIGSYEIFTDKNILITNIDNHVKVMKKRREVSPSVVEFKSFKEIFQNDFLFLNNYAFIDKKHNTHGWNRNFIVSPSILNDEFTKIDNKNLHKVRKKDSIENRELFLYFKKKDDSNFVRADILVPNINLTNERFLDLVALTHELKK